jgi:hypothetical protein
MKSCNAAKAYLLQQVNKLTVNRYHVAAFHPAKQ